MKLEKSEIKDILISVAVLSIVFSRFIPAENFLTALEYSVIITIFCFVIHELAHRFTANYYGFAARYVAWPLGLAIALFFSMFGIVFAAPGAVYIFPYSPKFAFEVRPLTRRESALISLAGPLSNIVTGIISLLFFGFSHFWLFLAMAHFSFYLAFFNLLPIPPLDGSKVFIWNPKIYLAVLALSAFLTFVV